MVSLREPAQTGHQRPWTTVKGLEVHSCPHAHRQRSEVLSSMYQACRTGEPVGLRKRATAFAAAVE